MELRHTAEGTNLGHTFLFSHLKTHRCRTHFYDCLLSAPSFAVTQTFMHTAWVLWLPAWQKKGGGRGNGGCMFYQTAALICRSAQEAKHSWSQGFYRCLKWHRDDLKLCRCMTKYRGVYFLKHLKGFIPCNENRFIMFCAFLDTLPGRYVW